MANLKILYISSEIHPFLNTSYVAEFVGKLAPAIQAKSVEIRILVPRFGVINERRNRLHEVVRLSGSNILVGNEERTLIVKVASIPGTRLQVYFIDNETYFHRKHIFTNKENKFFEDNDERLIFLCKGALETVKNLEWAPDIVHCHDWFTSLVPAYLKTSLKNDPIFQNTKVLFNIYNNNFTERFEANFPSKAKMLGMEDSDLAPLASAGFQELINFGAQYADVVIQAEDINCANPEFLFAGKEPLRIPNDETGIEDYYQLYNKLAEKE